VYTVHTYKAERSWYTYVPSVPNAPPVRSNILQLPILATSGPVWLQCPCLQHQQAYIRLLPYHGDMLTVVMPLFFLVVSSRPCPCPNIFPTQKDNHYIKHPPTHPFQPFANHPNSKSRPSPVAVRHPFPFQLKELPSHASYDVQINFAGVP
jgi:hypothetical protein